MLLTLVVNHRPGISTHDMPSGDRSPMRPMVLNYRIKLAGMGSEMQGGIAPRGFMLADEVLSKRR
jgi:hypothetical protein